MIDDAQLARRLLDLDLVTRDQIKQGRQLQRRDNTTLYEALILNKVADERAVVKVVARALNLPCVHLVERQIDPDVKALVPAALAREHRVLPLELRSDMAGDQLLLAMADPLDIIAMDEVASHVRHNIQPVLAGPHDLDMAIDLAYSEGGEGFDLGFGDPNASSFDFGALSSDEPGSVGQDEDSWAVFFDEANAREVPTEHSAVISQEMRSRPSTINLDMMDVEEVLDEVADDPLSMLDEPSVAHQNSGPLMELDDWELDESIEQGEKKQAEPKPSAPAQPTDYAAVGSFYVYQNPAEEKKKKKFPKPPSEFSHEGKKKKTEAPAPPPPEPESEADVSEPEVLEVGGAEDPFAQLFDDADDAASGTFVASPSRSFTEPPEEDDDEIEIVLEEIVEAGVEEPDEAWRDLDEADEAPSHTAVAGMQHVVAASEDVPPALEPSEVDEDDGSHTAVSNPAAFFADISSPGSSAPEEEGDEEDIFAAALEEIEGAVDPEPLVEEPPAADEAGSALGRLKLKRVAVTKKKAGIIKPVVEKNSHRKRQEAKAAARDVASKPALAPEKAQESPDQILSADDLIAGFEAALDDSEAFRDEADVSHARVVADDDPSTREIRPEDLLAATEGSLKETTATGDESERKARSIARLMRGVSKDDEGKKNAFERTSQETTANQALTEEFLRKMREETAGHKLQPRKPEFPTLQAGPGVFPEHVTDRQLLRAMLMILIGKDLIDFDELIALAESLPRE